MALSSRQLLAACVLSATAVVVAASGSVLYAETAKVKISVPPQRLEANVTLSGGQASGDLHTQHIEASVIDSQQGTASTVRIGAISASGQVEFSCSPSPCSKAQVTIPQGTLVSSSKLLGYATEVAATVTTGPTSVAVRATAGGPAWNTDAGTITTIANSPDPNLHVTNPAAITGGADARSAQVIQQSDFDAARSALSVKVNNDLDADLKSKAQGLSYRSDALPVLNLKSDHNVGDETPSFTITMSGTLGAYAFSESEAQALLRSALMARVPPYEELTADPIQATYQILQASPNGDVVVTGEAVGFVVPKLSPQSLRTQIKGMTPAQAARSLQRTVPGSLVEIQISPAAVPWLPLVAEHISVTIVVEPALNPIAGISNAGGRLARR